MNGRALFTYNPDLFKDEEMGNEETKETKEEAKVDENLFAAEADANDEEVDFDWK